MSTLSACVGLRLHPGVTEPERHRSDWRGQARRVFGTDDLDEIERQLGQDAASEDEARVRRAVLFRALAARDAERRSDGCPPA